MLSRLILLTSLLVFSYQTAMADSPDIEGCVASSKTFFSSPGDVLIPEGSEIQIPIDVSEIASDIGSETRLLDVDVYVDIAHDISSSLELTLVAANMEQVDLSSGNGGSFADKFTTTNFDDQANRPIVDFTFVGAGPYDLISPEQPLTKLDGIPAAELVGIWNLKVQDSLADAIEGTVREWRLVLTTCQNLPAVSSQQQEISPAASIDSFTAVTSTLAFSDLPGDICGIEVNSKIPHVFSSDLLITLSSPSGTVVKLSSDNGEGSDFFSNASWKDTQSPIVNSTSGLIAPTTQDYAPEQALSSFYGESAEGDWTLEINDSFILDDGILEQWGLNISTCQFAPAAEDQNFSVDENSANGTEVGVIASYQYYEIGNQPPSAPSYTTSDLNGLLIDTVEESILQSVSMMPLDEMYGAAGKIALYSAGATPGTDPALDFVEIQPNFTKPGEVERFQVNLSLPAAQTGLQLVFENSDSITHNFGNLATTMFPGEAGIASITGGIGDSAPESNNRFFSLRLLSTPKNFSYEIIDPSSPEGMSLDPSATELQSFGLFAIDTEGLVTVADSSRLDFESFSDGPPELSVRITDTLSNTSKIMKLIVDLNDLPELFPDADGDGVPDSEDQCEDSPDFDANENGVADCLELASIVDLNGTCTANSEDCGFDRLGSRACVGANAFLGQINITSVVNYQETPLNAVVSYFDNLGSLQNSVQATIPPGLKQDFIINDLGLLADTVGTVCVETDAGIIGAWGGGNTLYKPSGSLVPTVFGDNFDFALYYPFTNSQYGKWTVPLNTFHLGTHPNDLVANWISIADTKRDDHALKGIIKYYDQFGELLGEDSVFIEDGGRADFDAHSKLGQGLNIDAIGLARFEPEPLPDGKLAPYYINMTRYFYNCQGGGVCEEFLTALNLPKRPATAAKVIAGISTTNSETSVIELSNISKDTPAVLEIKTYQKDGLSQGNQEVTVSPLSTIHIVVNGTFLDNNQVGSASLEVSSGAVMAVSLFYGLTGGILDYGYAVPTTGSPGDPQITEFNSFIQHNNQLEIYNPDSVLQTTTINFKDFMGTVVYSRTETIPAFGTSRIDPLGLPVDTYGSIEITGESLSARNFVIRDGIYTLPFVSR